MGYHRYEGNTGAVRWVDTPEEVPPPPPGMVPPPPPGPPARTPPLRGALEQEDWLVLGILWLLYRSSGDKELLIALGAYLIL